MKKIINYYWIQSDHILASPEFGRADHIEVRSEKQLEKYILSQKDEYNHPYRKSTVKEKRMFGFDYMSGAGGVKVKAFKPIKIKFKKI